MGVGGGWPLLTTFWKCWVPGYQVNLVAVFTSALMTPNKFADQGGIKKPYLHVFSRCEGKRTNMAARRFQEGLVMAVSRLPSPFTWRGRLELAL